MKKFCSILLLIATILTLFSCGTYTGPQITPGGTEDGSQSGNSSADTTDPDGESEPFTATLFLNGQPFTSDIQVQVQWSNETTFKRASIDENGTATVKGLDGDFSVTLVSLPDGYTYNPNIYRAGNDNRHVNIEIFELTPTTGSGKDIYEGIINIDTGVFRTTIKAASKGNSLQEVGGTTVMYFQFAPSRSGYYSIESLMDITLNRYNPIVDIYNGTFSFKHFRETQDGGGTSSTFTKNFYWEVYVDAREVGNVFAFGVRVDAMDGDFPVNVDFTVQYNGAYSRVDAVKTIIVPQFPFPRDSKGNILPYGRPTGTLTSFGGTDGSRHLLDETKVGLNEEDGFYHFLDENGEPNGKIIFAYITSAHPYFLPDSEGGQADSFVSVEYRGNTALTVSNGTENYKLFIEGYAHMMSMAIDENGAKYNPFAPGWPYEGYAGVEGYSKFCNSDGVCPVTAELKDFLQKYSISQRLFMDGNGWAEDGNNTYADEASQWLFACCYYA